LRLEEVLICVLAAPKKKEQQKMSLGTFLQDESKLECSPTSKELR
jgi:hypothetical protein